MFAMDVGEDVKMRDVADVLSPSSLESVPPFIVGQSTVTNRAKQHARERSGALKGGAFYVNIMKNWEWDVSQTRHFEMTSEGLTPT